MAASFTRTPPLSKELSPLYPGFHMLYSLSRYAIAIVCAVFLVPFTTKAESGQALNGDDTKPPAYTWHDYRAQLLTLNRETLAGAYTKVGKHGPWDDAVVKFLDRMAAYFTNGAVGDIYKKDPVKHPELIATGKAVLDAGCKDPLVAYCYGVVLHDSGRAAEAIEHVRAAVDGLEPAGYPSMRIALAAARLRQLLPSKDGRAQLEAIIIRHYLQIASGRLDDLQRRLAASHITKALGERNRTDEVAFLDALRKRPDADPWVLNVLDGRLHTNLAWDSRGRDWANTVTKEGWQGFHDHLAKARDSLAAAYKLAPQLPEPALAMISVAMGDDSQLGEKIDTWFDRATAAQLDYTLAYDAMFNALLPRWGGSHAAIYDLGLRGMKTGRYDTEAPWQLIRAVEAIAADTGRGWGMLSQPTVYEALSHVSEQYAAAQKDQAAWYSTFHAALAWRAEKFVDARKLFDKLGDRIDPTAFFRVGSKNPPAAIGHVYVMSGPTAEEADKAESALQRGRYEEALQAFRAIQSAPALHPRTKPYLDARIALADRRAKFERGEWIDIQPADASLTDWHVASGAWNVDPDGQFLGRTAGRFTPTAFYAEPLGSRVEIAGIMQGVGAEGGLPGVTLGRGMFPGFNVGFQCGQIFLFSGSDYRRSIPVAQGLEDMSKPIEFTVSFDNGKLGATIAGKPVLTNHGVPLDRVVDLHLGVHVGTGGLARFCGLKVRKISDAKAKPAATPEGDGLE